MSQVVDFILNDFRQSFLKLVLHSQTLRFKKAVELEGLVDGCDENIDVLYVLDFLAEEV